MFTIVNSARGYPVAGLLGALTLLVACATRASWIKRLLNAEALLKKAEGSER
jgi:hypothetical protein